MKVYAAQYNGIKLFFGITGMGFKNVRNFFKKVDEIKLYPKIVLSTGYAGAINPLLKTGEILVIDDIYGSEKIETGKGPQLSEFIKCNNIKTGAIYSSEILMCRKDKTDLYKKLSFISLCDMESLAVADECIKRKHNLMIIRAVSDRASAEMPSGKILIADGRKSAFEKIIYFVQKPKNIFLELHLFIGMKKAQKSIFNTIKKFIIFLCEKEN